MCAAADASFADARRAIGGVDGWLTDAQARRLWDAATAVPEGGRIVEIGSFRGRSTVVLALAAAGRAGEIVAIDPHAGNDRGPRELGGFETEAATDHEVFNANLERAGVREHVRHVRRFSSEATTEVGSPVDVLYVDGAHRYRPALDDLRTWGDRVATGGTMLVHDAFSSVGVTLALLRSVALDARWRYAGRDGSLVVYRREARALRGRRRLANAGRQVGQLPWFARNLAVKLLIVARLHKGPWPY
jgi:predicted O-methyltransferase YrrM